MAHMMQVLHNCVLKNEKCMKPKIILYSKFMRKGYIITNFSSEIFSKHA